MSALLLSDLNYNAEGNSYRLIAEHIYAQLSPYTDITYHFLLPKRKNEQTMFSYKIVDLVSILPICFVRQRSVR